MPVHLLNYLDKYTTEHNPNKNVSVVENYKALKRKISECEELQTFVRSSQDKELTDLAVQDIEDVSNEIQHIVDSVRDELVPGERYDAENAMLEVVPGAGGQEASLFAEEIFHLYVNYCQDLGCEVEVVEMTKNTVNKSSKAVSSSGIVKAVARVMSEAQPVFRLLKFESGVHRVQRVPVTGTKADRLQTSTCSVAVLPEPRDIKVQVSDRDLKWEYMRASGAGGQGVQTADSAVRLTHISSNTVVESQEERSQLLNKKRALKKLEKILYQQQWETDQKKVSSSRKLQVGNMNRNEKIRTYNFNRHMVTDHRINKSETFPSIQQWLGGQYGYIALDTFRDSLELLDKEDRFSRMLASV